MLLNTTNCVHCVILNQSRGGKVRCCVHVRSIINPILYPTENFRVAIATEEVVITLIAEEVATLVEVTTIRIVEAEEGDMEETAAEEVMEVVVTEEGPVEVKVRD